EEEVESRYEAGFGVLIVIGLQAALAGVSLGKGWTLVALPGWVWLIPGVPEAALLLALSWSLPRHRLEQMGRRRAAALVLVGVNILHYRRSQREPSSCLRLSAGVPAPSRNSAQSSAILAEPSGRARLGSAALVRWLREPRAAALILSRRPPALRSRRADRRAR